jgi:hypothetical protein
MRKLKWISIRPDSFAASLSEPIRLKVATDKIGGGSQSSQPQRDTNPNLSLGQEKYAMRPISEEEFAT